MRWRFEESILFEDDNCLVINKASGIASLHERDASTMNVITEARKYCPDAQLCHRLDRETSGALIIAKNPETYRSVSMAFENRQVEKIYHAIVGGAVRMDELQVNLPIYVNKKGLVKVDFKQGKEAVTLFQSLEIFKHFTLMECMPITGRMHQIRVHLASQNAAIAADTQYGGEMPFLSRIKSKFHHSKLDDEKPMIQRFALHAFSLFVQTEKVQVDVKAPYPKDFDVFVKLLRKYDS
jgi:23S rRNA pseudouridine955/2504/2580 synthase